MAIRLAELGRQRTGDLLVVCRVSWAAILLRVELHEGSPMSVSGLERVERVGPSVKGSVLEK